MLFKEYTCPSCGAPIQQQKPGARMLGCTYCGQTSFVNADSLQAVGEKAPLIDYGSTFGIGKIGSYQDKEFMVLGRLRYDYEDGFWDEWYLSFFEGESMWVQEDDGSFVLYYHEDQLANSLNFDSTQVGSTVKISEEIHSVFVTSKSKATIHGGEGELPFRVTPGSQADFIDGIMKGRIISVEFLPEGPHVFLGKPMELEDFKLRD